MRRVYSFMLTSSISYGCKYCGHWQKISRWKWVALMACKRHERNCERGGQ